MANTLFITKETGGYFTFLLTKNLVAQTPIQSIRNDLLVYGSQCHFKTGSGANIIKEQFILPTDITIVSSGTFTFTTVAQVWAKLIEIGYFDWLNAGSGGTGVDRFDDLLDTFKYIGNNGYAVVVNESEQKLKTVPFYNYKSFTELNDTPDALVADKMLVVNSAGTALELKDQPTIVPPSLTSVGSFHYVDLATQTVPLTVVAAVEKKITNDTADTTTNVLNAPYGISSMWDVTNNQLDFTQTAVGDLVTVIPAIEITTTIANQNVKIYIKLGIGSSNPTTKQVFNTPIKAIGSVIINPTSDFVIDTLDIKDYPAEIFILSDDAATVESGALDIKVVRKNINVVGLNAGMMAETMHGAFNKTSLVDADEIAGTDSDADYSLIRVTVLNLWNYIKSKADTFYQSILISGTNIKTINGSSILGSGNLVVSGGESETTTTMGALINSATAATPNDTDLVATAENAGLLKKITWTNVKAFFKTYFDTVYTTTGAVATQITTALSGYLTSATAASTYETITNVALKVTSNTAITGATKTKVTYDSKGLVTSGADATTADIADSTDKRYCTDAQKTALHPQETAATIAAIGHAATAKTVLVDADEVTGQNSATSFSFIRTVWSDVWTYIKSKADSVYQATLVSGTNIKTINGSSVLGSGDIAIVGGGGDMVLASTQTVLGLKTFLNGMLGFRNVADTFTSFFSSSATAARTYTLQDRSGIVADDTDLVLKRNFLETLETFTTQNYTLNLANINKLTLFRDNTNSGNLSIIVPTNATIAFPIGTVKSIINNSVGSYPMTVSGSGVTFVGNTLTAQLNEQINLIKVATDTWQVIITISFPSFFEFSTANNTIWNNGKSNIGTNTSFGQLAIAGISSGATNTAYGYASGQSLTTGGNNTILGHEVMRYCGASSAENIGLGSSSITQITGNNLSLIHI